MNKPALEVRQALSDLPSTVFAPCPGCSIPAEVSGLRACWQHGRGRWEGEQDLIVLVLLLWWSAGSGTCWGAAESAPLISAEQTL